MQTQTIPRVEVQALLHRARCGMVIHALESPSRLSSLFIRWQERARALSDLLSDPSPGWIAAKDASLGGYHTYGPIQAAVTRLPENFEDLTLVEVCDLMARENIAFSTQPVTHSNVDAIPQLVDGVVAVIKPHDEHAVAAVDSHNGAVLHGTSVSHGGAL